MGGFQLKNATRHTSGCLKLSETFSKQPLQLHFCCEVSWCGRRHLLSEASFNRQNGPRAAGGGGGAVQSFCVNAGLLLLLRSSMFIAVHSEAPHANANFFESMLH